MKESEGLVLVFDSDASSPRSKNRKCYGGPPTCRIGSPETKSAADIFLCLLWEKIFSRMKVCNYVSCCETGETPECQKLQVTGSVIPCHMSRGWQKEPLTCHIIPITTRHILLIINQTGIWPQFLLLSSNRTERLASDTRGPQWHECSLYWTIKSGWWRSLFVRKMSFDSIWVLTVDTRHNAFTMPQLNGNILLHSPKFP